MTVTDEYLKNNEVYASTFEGPLPPSKHVAVVACMDAVSGCSVPKRSF